MFSNKTEVTHLTLNTTSLITCFPNANSNRPYTYREMERKRIQESSAYARLLMILLPYCHLPGARGQVALAYCLLPICSSVFCLLPWLLPLYSLLPFASCLCLLPIAHHLLPYFPLPVDYCPCQYIPYLFIFIWIIL